MIEKLKMVNWKSHSNTELCFSKGTNLLIGTMGSGKTSCLDAICFAFFGSFPALKSRQVSLSDVIMSRPEKKESAFVEVQFQVNGQQYIVTRAVTPKGSEAFLRKGSALIEGPQPVRVTESVARVLKVDYDTFVRVIYGEQNKIDYFLSLPKSSRKVQFDELLGISLFENVRTNANAALLKLRGEKANLETFLAGVDVISLQSDLQNYKNTLASASQKKNELESLEFVLTAGLENSKRELESIEESAKLNGELSLEVAKLAAEINSLTSSASSVMPEALAEFTREQCTSLLEQCARALQERVDLEHSTNELTVNAERLSGELNAVKKNLEQLSSQSIETEMKELANVSKDLETASQEFMELSKTESGLQSSQASITSELKQIAPQVKMLREQVEAMKLFEKQFVSIADLEKAMRDERDLLMETEKIIAARTEAVSTLEVSLSLLGKQGASCPTCNQQLNEDKCGSLIVEKKKSLGSERVVLEENRSIASKAKKKLVDMEKVFATWRQLLPLAEKCYDLTSRETTLSKDGVQVQSELQRISKVVATSKATVDAFRAKLQRFNILKENLTQIEKNKTRLTQIQADVAVITGEIDKKNLVLKLFDGKKHLETRLAESRAALKAIELIEKTEVLKQKHAELVQRKAQLQFDEKILRETRQKHSTLQSQLESNKVSLRYVVSEVKEKTELVSRLETQFARLSTVKKNAIDIENNASQLTIFQNSVVETQTQLRTELITAVNSAMQEVWKNIYPYKDYASCRVVATEDDYLLEVLAGSEWKPIEQCSGGEKTCAALCLRISLAMVLVPNLSWLVLDEPTHNLDANGVQLLARAMHETLPTIVKQTFVVTHDETLKEGASGAVHVFNRDKEIGTATIVETLT